MFRVLIKREILTSREVLYTKLICVLQKKCFPKNGFFSLKNASSSEENWQSMFLKIFLASADEEMGKWSKLVEVCNSKSFSNSCLRDQRPKSRTSWRQNHIYILSCKHDSRPIRARVLVSCFIKITIKINLKKKKNNNLFLNLTNIHSNCEVSGLYSFQGPQAGCINSEIWR